MAKQQVRKKTTPAPVAEQPPTNGDSSPAVAADVPRTRRARTAKSATPPAEVTAAAAAPSLDQIAQRAYFRFLERGGLPGFELEDWLAAEAELKQA